MKLARLHPTKTNEPIWHVQLAIILVIFLQLSLNDQFLVGPKFLMAAAEILLLFALALINPNSNTASQRLRRTIALILIGLITLTNIVSLILIVDALLHGSGIGGSHLIASAVNIFITNIIIFGVWYWEMDRTDIARLQVVNQPARSIIHEPADFLFPQAQLKQPTRKNWQPTFFDYLYTSITNATAFSPTDAMPLTHRAKLLMAIQSLVSLATVVLVAARAINILR